MTDAVSPPPVVPLRARIAARIVALMRRFGWLRAHELDALRDRLGAQARAREAALQQAAHKRETELQRQASAREAQQLAALRDTLERQAREREAQLLGGMRARELTAAQQLNMARAAAAQIRADLQDGDLAEAAVRGEIDRLAAMAARHGATDYNPAHILEALRAGRVSACAMSPERLLGDTVGARMVFLAATADEGAAAAAARMGAAVLHAPFDGADGGYDVVVIALALETEADAAATVARAAALTAEGGRLLLLGPLWGAGSALFASPWRTPPLLLQSLLPAWTWSRFILCGPGGHVGIEVLDPTLLRELRPATGDGPPLIAPPFMHVCALAINDGRTR